MVVEAYWSSHQIASFYIQWRTTAQKLLEVLRKFCVGVLIYCALETVSIKDREGDGEGERERERENFIPVTQVYKCTILSTKIQKTKVGC